MKRRIASIFLSFSLVLNLFPFSTALGIDSVQEDDQDNELILPNEYGTEESEIEIIPPSDEPTSKDTPETDDFGLSNRTTELEPDNTNPSVQLDKTITPSLSEASIISLQEDNAFCITPANDSDRALDISGGSLQNGAHAQIYSNNDTPAQRFRFLCNDDDSLTIVNIKSNLVLDVAGGKAEAGTNIQQYQANGTDAQKWFVIENEDGTTSFISALVNKDGHRFALRYSDGSGLLSLEEWQTSKSNLCWQVLAIQGVVENGLHYLHSSASCAWSLDVSGGSMNDGANAQLYQQNETLAQKFNFTFDPMTGYYTITNANSLKVLDVAAGSSAPGTNVQQWSANNTWAQKWAIHENEDETLSLSSAVSGLALDISGGLLQNGSNIQVWTPNETEAQHWSIAASPLISPGIYSIVSAINSAFALDIAGGKNTEYTNVQLYTRNNSDAQKFEIAESNTRGYYTIRSQSSGKYLSVIGTAQQGANVAQLSLSNDDSQLWKPSLSTYGITFTSKDGFVLDAAGGEAKNGSNIQVWKENQTKAQSFLLKTNNADLLGITDFTAKASGSIVSSVLLHGSPYLFLPSTTNISDINISFSTPNGSNEALVSDSVEGPYTSIRSGGALDLALFNKNTDGTYSIFITEGSGLPITKLTIMVSANISSMFIVSDNPANEGRYYVDSSPDHSAKADATMILVEPDGAIRYGSVEDSDSITIKGRGNSTWVSSEKKPYQIKLEKKTDLLGTGDKTQKAKTWILLANAGDSTLLHNLVAYNLALEAGLTSSPECKSIDLYYDGEYRGTYLLCEKVEINSGRIDIEDLEEQNEDYNEGIDIEGLALQTGFNAYGKQYRYSADMNTPDDYSGGYLIELDSAYYQSEASWFATDAGTFVSKSPEFLSETESRYISEFTNEAIECLENSGVNPRTGKKIDQYFDLDSLAKVYLINEFSKNIDSYATSTYFYKPQGEDKLYAGPVWDFDTSFGTRNEIGSAGYVYSGYFAASRSFNAACMTSDTFRAAITSNFDTVVGPLINQIVLSNSSTSGTFLKSLNEYYSEIKASQSMNEALWGVSNFGNCLGAFATYKDNVSYLYNWIAWRSTWMSVQSQSWKTESFGNKRTVVDGFDYALVYDYYTYTGTYSDILNAFGDDDAAALEHFVRCGMAEGRQGSYNFNVWAYRSRYSDLQRAFGDDLTAYYRHYIQYGFLEGRNASQ